LCEDGFRTAGITVRYHEFHHPTYPQFGREGFVSHLCALDLLMNQPEGALEIIRRGAAGEAGGAEGLDSVGKPTLRLRDLTAGFDERKERQ
jgi:hypothetical protein